MLKQASVSSSERSLYLSGYGVGRLATLSQQGSSNDGENQGDWSDTTGQITVCLFVRLVNFE